MGWRWGGTLKRTRLHTAGVALLKSLEYMPNKFIRNYDISNVFFSQDIHCSALANSTFIWLVCEYSFTAACEKILKWRLNALDCTTQTVESLRTFIFYFFISF